MTSGASDSEFLVGYDYGNGGLWAVVMAPSREAILAKYPEVDVVDDRPKWLTAERYEAMRSSALWLDDDPPMSPSLFAAVRAARRGE
jgi:hypothetical protein